ncbi:MAG: hypothetical protein IPO19_09325 [Rhodoferax sp.]|nr:hypothetical protein [Rhodoferax sp.]
MALGLGFVTLAVPLALDARWTSAVWAAEGAAVLDGPAPGSLAGACDRPGTATAGGLVLPQRAGSRTSGQLAVGQPGLHWRRVAGVFGAGIGALVARRGAGQKHQRRASLRSWNRVSHQCCFGSASCGGSSQ